MMLRAFLAVSFLLFLAACGDGGDKKANATVREAAAALPHADANEVFDATVEDLTKRYFASLPEMATYMGAPPEMAPGADARLNDRSIAGEAARRAEMGALLTGLEAIDPGMLDPDRARIRATLITLMDGALGPSRLVEYGGVFAEYGVWFLPYVINQNSGPTIDIPNLMEAQQSVKTPEEAETYLTRLAMIAPTMDGVLEKMRHDVALGAIPPDFILEKASAVIDGFAAAPARENVLYASFVNKLEAAGVAGADDFEARALTLVEEGVLPAYRRISAYLAEIKPGAPHEAGVWRLPNGEALYKAMVRHMTDEPLNPDDVHQIGLDEVVRITAEMDRLLRAEGMTEGTVGERMTALRADARFTYPNTDEGKAAILSDIQTQLAGVRAALPKWFGTLPKYDVEVRAVPAFSQDSAPGGYYDSPALDGSRPGIYWINLRDTAIWPKYKVPTLTYHEAIPGHHMQNAISLEQDAPLISAIIYSNPSGEGWALYSEALAAEMGLYDGDPFGNLGRLQDELHRAVRLVVDTGMHAKKWSREQAIDYMVATEGNDRSEAVSEIERYVVWPGQALGYKIGMLKLQALRADAEAAFGDDFDIREFHDRVLKVSSSALPVIDAEIRAWIAEADVDH